MFQPKSKRHFMFCMDINLLIRIFCFAHVYCVLRESRCTRSSMEISLRDGVVLTTRFPDWQVHKIGLASHKTSLNEFVGIASKRITSCSRTGTFLRTQCAREQKPYICVATSHHTYYAVQVERYICRLHRSMKQCERRQHRLTDKPVKIILFDSTKTCWIVSNVDRMHSRSPWATNSRTGHLSH